MECRGGGGLCSTIQNCLNVFQGKVTANEGFSFNYTEKSFITAEIVIQGSKKHSDPGKSASLWLYSGTKIDPSKFYTGNAIVKAETTFVREKLSTELLDNAWQWQYHLLASS